MRDNCVISEVRVNKHKLQYEQGRNIKTQSSLKPMKTKQRRTSQSAAFEKQTPSAPQIEILSEEDVKTIPPVESRGRRKSGGLLLQKRLSNPRSVYKSYIIDPPPKPPRSSVSFEEKSSATNSSTSSSVRKAERVLDEFLASRGYHNSKTKEKRQSHNLGKSVFHENFPML